MSLGPFVLGRGRGRVERGEELHGPPTTLKQLHYLGHNYTFFKLSLFISVPIQLGTLYFIWQPTSNRLYEYLPENLASFYVPGAHHTKVPLPSRQLQGLQAHLLQRQSAFHSTQPARPFVAALQDAREAGVSRMRDYASPPSFFCL